jgi:hypothetical protein
MDQSGLLPRNGEVCLSSVGTPSSRLSDGYPEHAIPSAVAPFPKKRGRGPLLWGMGGTLLSALGFVGLALFEQYNGMVTELRNDLKHFNETTAELVKKDSLQRLRDQLRGRFKEIEESATARKELERELNASEKAREEMTRELQRMRERLAYLAGRQTASPSVVASSAAQKQPPGAAVDRAGNLYAPIDPVSAIRCR